MWRHVLIASLIAAWAAAGCGDASGDASMDAGDSGGATDADTTDVDGPPDSGAPDGAASDALQPDTSPDAADGSTDGSPPIDAGGDTPLDSDDDATTDVVTGPRCGDGRIDANEVCDDGNTTGGDGCSDRCRLDDGAVALVINEVVASAEVGEDWVELVNPNAFAIRADGWALTDGDGLPAGDPDRPFVIAADTFVLEYGYIVFERDAEGSFGFGFASGGDSVQLLTPRGEVSDETTWTAGQAELGTSWGRTPNITGSFATLAGPTRGTPNP